MSSEATTSRKHKQLARQIRLRVSLWYDRSQTTFLLRKKTDPPKKEKTEKESDSDNSLKSPYSPVNLVKLPAHRSIQVGGEKERKEKPPNEGKLGGTQPSTENP